METTADILVVGGGIAGVSAAAALAECRSGGERRSGRAASAAQSAQSTRSARSDRLDGSDGAGGSRLSVIVLEAEQAAGYHATGRSAAYFAAGYGNRTVRDVTAWSAGFFSAPPAGFSETPLLRPRQCVFFARADQMHALDELQTDLGTIARRITGEEVRAAVPVMRGDYPAAGLLIEDGGDIDVDALLQGYLRALRARGGRLIGSAPVSAIERAGESWRVLAGGRAYRAKVIVNAAGAWADGIAAMAGLEPLGLEPRRRSACLVDAPEIAGFDGWPLMVDVEEAFYFKPDAGALLLSPADETPSPVCDAAPDDLDIAVAVARFEDATTCVVERARTPWAGLRTFAADRTPVVGFDPRAPGFFWLAAQGGYGVQTAPALARLAAHLIAGGEPPAQGAALEAAIEATRPERLLEPPVR